MKTSTSFTLTRTACQMLIANHLAKNDVNLYPAGNVNFTCTGGCRTLKQAWKIPK